MEICNEHDIAYSSRECPACEIQRDRDFLESEIGRLETELQSAEEYISQLEDKIAALEVKYE